MRAIVKNSIAVFSPQGFLDANNSSAFLSFEDIDATVELNVSMVLISLKKVVFFNKNGLDIFVQLFKKIREKNRVTVGFCDYDKKKFTAIKKFYSSEVGFSLFKTLEIASLFSKNFKNKEKSILVYSDDKSQRTAMAIELHDYGHNPIVSNSFKDFAEKSTNKAAYDYIIDDTYLGQMGENIANRVAGNAIIYTVSSFLDADILNTFNMAYHNNSLNVGFRLFIFNAHKVVSMNIHAFNFFSKLSTSAAEYNATIVFVGLDFTKVPESFKENMIDAGILFYEQMNDILDNKELLTELGASSSTNIAHKKVIDKQTVTKLPNFIDATVATIEMMTNSTASKESAEISNIAISETDGRIASSIGFYGEIEGIVILVFPTQIAKKACEVLIGENTDDIELILDTLAELVNIVGGKIKTLLSDQNINVSITLPRTYNCIEDLLEVVKDKKGVQVDLAFDNDKFLFFLTR